MVKYVLILLCIVVLFFVCVICIDLNRFVVKKYKVVTDKIKQRHKFVVLSDLHGKEYGKDNEKLLKAIDAQEPTAILIAGDMLTGVAGKEFGHVLKFLGALSEKYPIYYGNGNHEYRLKIYPETFGNMAEDYAKGLSKIGIFPLCNESTTLEKDSITIYGLEIDKEFYKKGRKKPMDASYMDKMLGKPDADRYNILLAHNPAYFEQYANWGADLVLSGHVHGGIMRLPFGKGVIAPSFALFPKYSGGKYEENNSTMILSTGLGCHTIPVRVFNPAQLVVVEVDNE